MFPLIVTPPHPTVGTPSWLGMVQLIEFWVAAGLGVPFQLPGRLQIALHISLIAALVPAAH